MVRLQVLIRVYWKSTCSAKPIFEANWGGFSSGETFKEFQGKPKTERKSCSKSKNLLNVYSQSQSHTKQLIFEWCVCVYTTFKYELNVQYMSFIDRKIDRDSDR